MSNDTLAAAGGPAAPSALPPGTRLGEVERRQVLGVGGFGIVHLAFDHDLERECWRAAFMAHPDCRHWRKEAPRRE